jgi:hypothetical protein
MLFNVCPKAVSFRDTRHFKMEYMTSKQCCHGDAQRVVRRTHSAQLWRSLGKMSRNGWTLYIEEGGLIVEDRLHGLNSDG